MGSVKDLGIEGIGPATLLARGGSAEVHLAEQTGFGRPVAVKVLFQPMADDAAWARFERECRAIGALSSHPNIVVVHDRGVTDEGFPFLVMEYRAGGSLADRLRVRGRLTEREVAGIGVKIGQALSAAHQVGVLHRDVKPANILLSAYDEPALADFGIAWVGDRSSTGSMFSASVLHAAREVLTGRRPTQQTDVYSFGSTLFELAVGTAAYSDPEDESMWAVIDRVLRHDRPDPRLFGVTDGLASIIDKATDHDVSRRYRSVDDLVADLTALLSPQPTVSGLGPLADTWIGPLADTLLGPAVSKPGADRLVSSGAAADASTARNASKAPDAGTAGAKGDRVAAGPVGRSRDAMLVPVGSDTDYRRLSRAASSAAIAAMALVTGALIAIGYAAIPPADDAVETMPAAGAGSSPVSTTVATSDRQLPTDNPEVRDAADSGNSDGPAGESDAEASGPARSGPDYRRPAPEIGFDRAEAGPLSTGETYRLDVSGLDGQDRWRLLQDGHPVTDWASGPVSYRAEPGRHSLQLQVNAGDRLPRSNRVEIYVADTGPEPGFRANLSAIRSEPGNWPEALRQFDQMVADGHVQLELSLSTKVEVDLAPHWNFYVDGFGQNQQAAQAYCDGFRLESDACFVAAVGVGD